MGGGHPLRINKSELQRLYLFPILLCVIVGHAVLARGASHGQGSGGARLTNSLPNPGKSSADTM
jgi:hypothetical protein